MKKLLIFIFVNFFFVQIIFAQYYKIELVKDILPGVVGAEPQDLVKGGNNLYFTANDGNHGRELWKSDGTQAGTQLVMDINPNGNASGDPGDLVAAGDNVFFRASDGNYGLELWRSQFSGIGAGTTTMVKDINPFGNSTPLYLTSTNNTVKFAANNGLNGEELWSSDGTLAGTQMVQDLQVGAVGSRPNGLFAVNNRVFFRTISFPGLFSANSSSINGPLEVTNYNDEDISPMNFTKVNNTLIFSGVGNSAFFDVGRELFYKEDGGEPVKLLKDIILGPSSSNPTQLTTEGETIYFIVSNGSNLSLWKSGETNSVVQVKLFEAGVTVSKLIGVNNTLYFFIFNNGETQLWKTNGTMAGTSLVKSLNNNLLFQAPTDAINFGGILIFSILHPTNGKELWQSDGTEAGTFILRDINNGPNGSDPNHFTIANNQLFFSADNGVYGRELYKLAFCQGDDINFTIKDGNWSDPSTWACGRVPTTSDQVTIKGHTININGNFGVTAIKFEGGNITIPVGSLLTYYPITP